MDNDTIGSRGNVLWLAQSILGILLVILLCVHLIVNHWIAPQGLLTYADVIRYYDFPGIALMESMFLVIVTSHCLLGLHSILLDLNLRPPATRMCTQFLIIIGCIAIIYGAYLIIKIA